MKKMHAKRSWIFFMVLALVLVLGKTPVFAATEVSDFTRLKNAVETGDSSITITGDITVTETLEIKKDVTISGDPKDRPKLILVKDFSEDQMFKVPEGKSLTLNDIILDGNKRGRLINVKGGTVTLKMADLQNGSTESLKPNASNDQNYSGGAILATKGVKQGSTVTIKDGFFVNNNTGSIVLSKDRNAEGGAIKIEDSTLTIDGTYFTDNHLDGSATEGGRQGGAIEATRTKAKIDNARFTILGPFNTGGGIKFEDCSDASVKDSTFMLRSGKGTVGVAGGAITSEGSNLTIDNSTFNTGKGSYVQESGGLIQVVGKGEFHLKNSTLNGSGVGWNQTGANKTAKFGGAIVFYDDSTVTATIENTTIQNFTAEISGGGIALNTQVGKKGGTKLTLTNTKILNNLAYAFDMTAYGGGIFVGKGNTVTMEGGQISSKESSSVGGAIYNEGKLTLTGTAENPAKIINNKAYHMAGGVLNDGELTVDYAQFIGNAKGDWSNGNQHVYKKDEMAGENIYAVKDVTITPNAQFDGKDVRILDGQSKIILTGPLTNQINVSISETPKKQGEATQNKPEYPLHPKFNETQNRKVGYLIAKGNGTYIPTASDAKVLNYVSNDTSQDVASADDHTGLGEWDFVLNPKTKQVVLGQRVKVTLHANGTDAAKAEFKEVKVGRNEEEGIFTTLVSDNQKQDVYDIYASGEKSAELAPEPIRKGYAFTGWYEEDFVNDDAPDKGKDGKTLVKDLRIVKDASEITTIIDPKEYELYAGWEKVIPVEKVWEDNNDEFKNRPDSVTVKLFLNGEDLKNSITLSAENNWKGEFKNLPESEEDILQYSVKEDPEQIKGYEKGVVTENDQDGFTVTNSTEFITIEGKKTWIHDGNTGTLPTTVTVTLNENGKTTDKVVTGDKWKFEKLPKYKNKEEVNYTLTEAPVENYTPTQNGYNFTNTYEKKYKVTYEFVSGTAGKILPDEVMALLPKVETGKDDGAEVTPKQLTSKKVDMADGTWTFGSWDAKEKTISGADVSFKGTWTLVEKTSDFTVAKAVDKATFEKAGDVLIYTVTVKNTGEKDLTGLTISDPKTTFENPTFDLKKSEIKTFTYTYTVTEADVKAKAVNNTATVTLGEKSEEASTKSTLVEKTSDFTVTKAVDKATFEKAGEELTYTVTVKNTGEKDLTGLMISDPKTTFDNPTFDLAKGKEKTFTYTYTVTEADVKAKAVNNTATVTLGEKSKEASTKSTLVEKTSDFTVAKAVDKATFEKAGEVLTYTVTVKNTGEKKLENLTISDSLVALNEDPFTLEVGEEKTFTYTYTVTEADVKAKAVNNTATVIHDNDRKSASAESKLKEDTPNPPTKVITQYVDENGNRLIPDRAGKQPVVEIKGYTFLRTEESDTLIRHIYKKIQAPTHPSGSVLILPTPGTSEPVPDDGLLNKKDHKAYMFGYPDGNFLPERNMTREEATAMFARLLKDYPRERRNYTIPFNDVAESDWSQQAIGFMLEKGMIKGYEDGSFKPKAAISRAEFAAMAARFDKLVAGTGNPFSDVPATHWAQGAIDSAAAKGWVTGYPDGSFKPERKITRAEVVNITNKMLDRFADKNFVRSHLSEMIQFKDLTEADWAYFPIMEATNGHDYTRKAAQEENWIRLNGEEFRFVVVGRK